MGTWNVNPVLLPSANILANPVATDEVWPPASINVTNAKHPVLVCVSVSGALAARAHFSQHRLCVSVQMLFTGFPALLFSARACPQHEGRGHGLQRNHHCLHPPVKRQLLDYPLQPRVSVQKCVCVCVFCMCFVSCISRQQWGHLHISLMTFSVVRVHLFKISLRCRHPVGSTKTHCNDW